LDIEDGAIKVAKRDRVAMRIKVVATANLNKMVAVSCAEKGKQYE